MFESNAPENQVKVYHQTNVAKDGERAKLGGYTVVLQAFYPSEQWAVDKYLDFLWEKTNHLDHTWTEDWGGREVLVDNPRSSMVGDIFQLGTRFWLVKSVGFEEIIPVGPEFPEPDPALMSPMEKQMLAATVGLKGVRVHKAAKPHPKAKEHEYIWMEWSWVKTRLFGWPTARTIALLLEH